jgi:hypothetical protein
LLLNALRSLAFILSSNHSHIAILSAGVILLGLTGVSNTDGVLSGVDVTPEIFAC